jgi:mono/diheme cytochrome c family protein
MAVGLFATAMAMGQGTQPHSTSEGVFSEAQARRGEDAYMSRCAQCHGDDLISRDAETPSLTGPRFKQWLGRTLADEFTLIRTTMPPTSPGSLDDQTSIDILTFVLKFNGCPTGPQDLAADSAVLEQIKIEAAPTPAD